jgi:O-antigen/teichoic acid export membrane protein
VGRFLGEVQLGLYNVAKTMALRPIDFLAMPLNRTVFPFYSKAAGDEAKIGSIFSRSIVGSVLFVMPVSLFLAVFADPVTRALYGDAFGPGSIALLALSLAMVVRTLGTFSGSLLVALGKSPVCTAAWLLGSIVTAGVLSLGPELSLSAVAWSFASGFVVVYGVMILGAFMSIRLPSDQRPRLGKAFVANLGSLALMLAVHSLPLGSWPKTMVAVAVCPAAHLVLVGLLLAGKPFECFSPRGVRRFWQEL